MHAMCVAFILKSIIVLLPFTWPIYLDIYYRLFFFYQLPVAVIKNKSFTAFYTGRKMSRIKLRSILVLPSDTNQVSHVTPCKNALPTPVLEGDSSAAVGSAALAARRLYSGFCFPSLSGGHVFSMQVCTDGFSPGPLAPPTVQRNAH